jgi:hypothetical protein
MNWLFWRQHRAQLLVAVGILVIYAIFIVLTGRYNLHADTSHNYFVNQGWVDIVRTTIAIPFLVGMFLGTPLLSMEYSEARGTNKLVWTQGISRRRWLMATLGWCLLFTVLCASAFSLLTSWWFSTIAGGNFSRFAFPQFDISGLVPIVHAAFGVVLGATLGAWLRKPLVALGVMLVMLCVVQVGIGNYVRPHYMRGIVAHTTSATTAVPYKDQIYITSTAKIICSANGTCYSPSTTYQPASRYWDFQGIEASLYAGLTALMLAISYQVVLKRDA